MNTFDSLRSLSMTGLFFIILFINAAEEKKERNLATFNFTEALNYFNVEDYEIAIPLLKKVIENEYTEPINKIRSKYALGASYYFIKDYQKALPLLKEVEDLIEPEDKVSVKKMIKIIEQK